MSIGPAPNLSGGVSTVPTGNCCSGLDSGNGSVFVLPTGIFAPPCNCNGNNGSGNDGCGCCCPKSWGGTGDCSTGSGNGNGNGGTCGGGGSTITVYGSGAPGSMKPAAGVACLDIVDCEAYCCWQSILPATPVNVPFGTFFAAPPAGAFSVGPFDSTGCRVPPPQVPVGAITPIPVPDSSSPYSQGITVSGGFRPPILLENVPITCAETGGTVPAPCGGAALFYLTTNTVYHYSTPAGPYGGCAGGGGGISYGSGSGSGVPGSSIQIDLSPV